MDFKNAIRATLNFLHLDLTKNLEYDRLTKSVMRKVIKSDSNCIDVGCHKGEILDIILSLAPEGKHYAFEPLPHLFENLKAKYSDRATVHPFALSNEAGRSTFQFIKNAPAYSGIKKRRYDIDNPEIEEITVQLKRLDDLIEDKIKIDFIKIDVEGAELGVLEGAKNILQNSKPAVVFEFGKGASDYYGTSPEKMFNLLVEEVGLQLHTLKGFINNREPLNVTDFSKHFEANTEYYFIAK